MGGPAKHKALINVDLGEGYGNWKCGPDDELIPLIDHANIACGFHAGDPLVIWEAVKLCKKYNVKVGAHPGLPDLQGFGRREMKLSPEEFTAIIVYQVGALREFLDREGVPLHHVKPHGVLYGMMCRDLEVARAVMAGVPKGVPVFGLAGTYMEQAAKECGLPFWAEFFGDVKYNAVGHCVVDRKKKPWVLDDVKAHVTKQLYETSAVTVEGTTHEFPIGDYPITICCHSDSPGCVEIVKATKEVADKFNKDQGFS